jgi:uncharacterized protein with HEPN domain
MSKKNYKSAEVYLKRMLEHIEKIEAYKKDLPYETFKLQEQDYDAICMQLSQIGENVSKIEKSSDRIVETFPQAINWKALKGLRNRIDHDYTWLEVDMVWEMLEDSISNLQSGVEEILKKRYGA